MDLFEAVPTLLQKTEHRKLAWEQLGPATFIARVGSVMVSISFVSNMQYNISLLNEQGSTLETKIVLISDAGNFRSLTNLYNLARHDALKINDALMDLKKGLDGL